MKNKESIKHVYDEIHAPDALFGKVMEMNTKQSKMRNAFKCAAGTAAAFAIAIVASNGVCYAATGETWISKAIVYINGEESEQEITWHQSGDTMYGELEVPVENGEEVQVKAFSFVTDSELPESVYIIAEDGSETDGATLDGSATESVTTDGTISDSTAAEGMAEGIYTEDTFKAEVVQERDKVFLITDEERIDITEDFSDGEATGTFAYSGLALTYTITGTVEECEISLSCE